MFHYLLGAQLITLRKIPCNLRPYPSTRLGGVVRTRLFDFDDLHIIYGLTVNKFLSGAQLDTIRKIP